MRNFVDSSSIHTSPICGGEDGRQGPTVVSLPDGAVQPRPAAVIDWSKYPIYYDNPHPPHSSAGTGLADTRMRGFSLEYFNILYHTRYWWPLPRLASIGTQHTALVIVFIPEVQDILLRKIVHLKFMSLDISQHAIFLPERRGAGAGRRSGTEMEF